MATPNYSYEKRQRELAKKRKTEEKRNRKSNPGRDDGQVSADPSAPAEGGPPPQSGTGETASAG
ncbi:hypothetical protein HZU83_13965 [Sphaerotilus montanus]|jgi:hypothetical protein|uniref:Uncharacterized protein n=1 Tax=Sphaerotilus montanus TaxID=522889 RepID=A0A7Y9QWW2_9BURK|nr:hypothetical protein [Sphaerotilus montanus]NYG31070.1 hypothetical protein [Sphaerotilus montanus]NZD57797.1 hypothetical protein [Sphaerotilus montanus]